MLNAKGAGPWRVRTRGLLGFHFATAIDEQTLATRLLDLADSGGAFVGDCPLVITPNTEHLVEYSRDEHQELYRRVRHASLVLPDGFPIVLASRILNRGLSGRITGSGLTASILEQLPGRSVKPLFVVSDAQVAAALGSEGVETLVAPRLEASPQGTAMLAFSKEVAHRVWDTDAQLVFVGLGFPKQEWLSLLTNDQLRKQGNAPQPLFFCVGSALHFAAGLKRRAPRVLRNTGFEWLFRFMQEPGRLGPRYLRAAVRFPAIVYRAWVRQS